MSYFNATLMNTLTQYSCIRWRQKSNEFLTWWCLHAMNSIISFRRLTGCVGVILRLLACNAILGCWMMSITLPQQWTKFQLRALIDPRTWTSCSRISNQESCSCLLHLWDCNRSNASFSPVLRLQLESSLKDSVIVLVEPKKLQESRISSCLLLILLNRFKLIRSCQQAFTSNTKFRTSLLSQEWRHAIGSNPASCSLFEVDSQTRSGRRVNHNGAKFTNGSTDKYAPHKWFLKTETGWLLRHQLGALGCFCNLD